MKIECNVIDAEAGIPTVIEYDDVLYFQEPPVEEQKPEQHKPRYNPYSFRRR